MVHLPWTESGGNISRSTGNVSVGEQTSEQIVTQNYNSLTNIPASSRASGTWRSHTFGNITLPANWSNDNFQFKVTVNGTLDGVPTAEYVSIIMKKQGSGTQPSVSLNFNPQNQSSGITSGGGNVYYTNVVNTNSTVSNGSFSAGDVVDIYMTIYVTYWSSLSLAVEIRGGGTTSILFVDGTNDRVGIGLTQPTTALDVSGTVKATAFEGDGSALTGIVAGQWTESSGNIQRSSGNVEVGVANLFVNTTLSRVGVGTSTPGYTLDVAGDLTCSGTMRHRAFAFYARASGGQIVANNGILSDSNSTITTEFDYTPAGTASSNGFRSSGGASNNQGTYFAPVDGIYHVSCKVRLNDSSTAQQEIQWYIKRTNGNEDQWESFEMWISPADGGGRRATMSSTIVKLAKDEGIFPRADNPTTSLSSATFGGHFLGTY